ncbi:MAG: limonene-1,2-epoxide hydrolase family protein, partial [Pseudomonadales bacterium]
TASDRVLAMISGWNERDLEAIVDCFADDAVYHNIPMEPVQGKQGIREAISGFVAGASAIQWDMLHIAENATGAVLTERLDKFEMGGKWIAVPVMGTFEVRDDLIVAWRDYFDLAGFQAQIE